MINLHIYGNNGCEELTRCNVDEGNQRKVSGLLFNLSLSCGHLSLQPDFVLASTKATSVFPSFSPHCPLLNLHVYYPPVIFLSEVRYIFISSCSTTNPLPLRHFHILQDTLAYSWVPCLITLRSASNPFLCPRFHQCCVAVSPGVLISLKTESAYFWWYCYAMSYLFIYFNVTSRHLCRINKYKVGQIFRRLEGPDLCEKVLQSTSTCAFAVVSRTINRDCF